jgi:excisionase family DNA binding protein
MATMPKVQPNIRISAADASSHGALNIVESAAYCGVRCSAIESVIRDGKLRGRRLGRNVIVLKADLDAFLASLEVIPVHTPPSILRRRRERSQ